MKIYRISKTAFWAIFILILALPVSRHWRLMSTGQKTTATVREYVRYTKTNIAGETLAIEASEVEFMAGDSLVTVYGPADDEMEEGRLVTLWYRKSDPTDFCLFTFPALYLSNYSILVLILLIVWGAFYSSYNVYINVRRGGKKSAPGKKKADQKSEACLP